MNDLTLAWRSLWRRPGFLAVSIATLALGVGSVSAIFSVVNGVLLEPLPYPDAERIVRVNRMQGQYGGPVSAVAFEDWRAATEPVFESFGVFSDAMVNLTGDGDAQRLAAYRVSPGFWDVMRLGAEHGRWFTAAEDAAGERVAVLANGLWRTRFGADPGIVGRDILLNGEPHRVVGVAPDAFRYPSATQVYLPASLALGSRERGSNWLFVIGRLRDGATLAQASALLETENRRLAEAYPDEHSGLGARLTPLPELLNSNVREPLLVLLGASALVLLIACANLANLLIARGSERSREMALRSALGAGRGPLVRLVLIEAGLLGAAGGLVGIGLASVAVPALLALAPDVLPAHASASVSADAVGVSLAVALVTVLAFALWPALRAAAVDQAEVLKAGARGSGDRDRASARALLVVAELALSVTLLVGAGLLIESMRQLGNQDLGVEPDGVLTAAFLVEGLPPVPGEDFLTAHRRNTRTIAPQFDAVLARLAAIPGVRHAAISDGLPLAGQNNISSGITLVGEAFDPENRRGANWRFISPDFIEALGMRIVTGRDLTTADQDLEGPRQVLVNETFVRRYLGQGDPLGREVVFMDGEPKRIVGVVGDTRLGGLDSEPVPEVYMPHVNSPVRQMVLALKVTGDPLAYGEQLRQALREVDPAIPLFDVRSMQQVIGTPIALRRFNMTLMSVFSAVALLLAAIGLYGVIAYAVAQRRRELGIRLSLGASPGGVAGLVLRQGGQLVAAGIGVGLCGALALSRLLASQLYGVGAADPAVIAVVVLAMAAVGAVALLVPARQAARVAPMEALRDE